MINFSKFQSFIILFFIFFGLLVLNQGALNEDLYKVLNFFTLPLIVAIFIIAYSFKSILIKYKYLFFFFCLTTLIVFFKKFLLNTESFFIFLKLFIQSQDVKIFIKLIYSFMVIFYINKINTPIEVS